MTEFKFDQIFTIVEDVNKNKQTIYRLKFRAGGTLVPNGMTNKKENIEGLGYRWIKKNPKEVADMVFELEVLGE